MSKAIAKRRANEVWLAPRKPLSSRRNKVLTVLSFLLPLLLWSAVSYLPFIWHPNVEITEPGSVSYFQPGMQVKRAQFEQESDKAAQASLALPVGVKVNPVYLPAPHEVAKAFYTSFSTEPKRRSEKWLHESLWQSMQVIFWGFFWSSLIGVPLGILCGTYSAISRLYEPFIEFFRYLPAPPKLQLYLLVPFFNKY